MNVTIIGAGNSGLAMAAHLASCGNRVVLWNRTQEHIKKLMRTRVIQCEGVIQGRIKISLATSNMREALKEADVVLVTTPATAHRELAKSIAENTSRSQTIVLNPGRTFGAIEFLYVYKQYSTILPKVAETQTILYTCRQIAEDAVNIIAFKDHVLMSSFDPDGTEYIQQCLPSCLQPFFVSAKSMVHTSIGNVGMVLHCAPLLLNTGWTESKSSTYKYYYDGITPTVASFISKIDQERIGIAHKLGYVIESTKEWMERTYGLSADNLFAAIQKNEAYVSIDAPRTMQHRYLLEDVPCGLVPLEAIGLALGVDVTHTTMTIDLANRLLDYDFREHGRNPQRLGIDTDWDTFLKLIRSSEGE